MVLDYLFTDFALKIPGSRFPNTRFQASMGSVLVLELEICDLEFEIVILEKKNATADEY